MDSETNISRLFLFFLRILQCSGSLIVIITEILRHIHVVYLIEREINLDIKRNIYELLFEYVVITLGFISSVIYVIRFNQRCKQLYKFDVFIDCLLMNAWMIFGILRLSPQFDDENLLNCHQYEPEKRKGCITYITTLALGFFISASYFLTAMISTWIRAGKFFSDNYSTNNLTNTSFNSSKSSLNRTESSELNGIRNSQIISDIPGVITREREEISLKEFIDRNKHLAHLFNENSEFNRTDGTIIILRKPTPPFLNNKHGPPSRSNSSLYENNSNPKYMSEYSLDSSFSRIYGSIIVPRKYTSTHSETDTNTCSTISKRDGRNQTHSMYSENSSQSLSLSDKTSRSSRYDGSIIIKLVA